MNREQAISIIRSSELAADADTLIPALQEAILIRTERVTLEGLPLGASRFGGCPDLPRGFEWPRCMGSDYVYDPKSGRTVPSAPKEVCLNFLAQINLVDLPASETAALLPSRGYLCFFYDCIHQPWGFDPKDKMGWRIAYFDTPSSQLVRTQSPQTEPECAFFPCRLSYAMEWTLPEGSESPESIDLDSDWCYDVQELQMDLNPSMGEFTLLHRLFGHAAHIQGDMKRECELASNGVYCGGSGGFMESPGLAAKAKDWRLLLQIDTDEEGPGWMWGDCGRLYYWIKDEDLRRRAFDKVWFVLQCS